ncbi:MAG: DUF2512 family protein [Firmicutes bacterium]|uniref:4 TMS phage holin, superfamily IV n=1 Tax=Melghirimyces thermohalophilus TaxID=1236220 RepID=A0A1G6I7N0_9BACL|nr:DUF2512 family protein [Melghirimyces thermohalophilus]MDA8351621.1 DUF2512 family protein [Bacillota bacterium]SDC02450.1 Protein of unknown function [Melghirimyces thermohalophilus]
MNFLLKLVIYSTVIHGVHLLVGGLNYTTMLAPMGLVLLFAVTGHFADRWILPKWGNFPATAAGTAYMIAWLWATQFLFPGSEVRFPVAFVTGLVLGIVEFRMHVDLLRVQRG